MLIEHILSYNTVCFGFGVKKGSDFCPEIAGLLNSIILDRSFYTDDSSWYGWQFTSYIDGYSRFAELIKIVLSKLKSV